MKAVIRTPVFNEEYNYLEKILKHYGFTADEIIKDGSVFRLSTNAGYLGLYPVKHHGREKIKKDCIMCDYAVKHGFDNIMGYYKDREGRLFVKSEGMYYYIKETSDVRECDITNMEEIKKSLELLANFHKAFSGRDVLKMGMTGKDIKYLPSAYEKWCSRIQKYCRIIENRKKRSAFDNLYHDNINQFYSEGILALSILKKSNYDKLLKEAKHNGQVCHGNFYYHNVLIDNDSNYYITGFDKASIDLKIYDLGRFLRKMLCRDEHCWDFNKAKMLIEAYNSIIPLSNQEIGIILSIIIFPYVFYKCGKKAYEKNNVVLDDKYIKKIEKQVEQIQSRKRFIEEYIRWNNILI